MKLSLDLGIESYWEKRKAKKKTGGERNFAEGMTVMKMQIYMHIGMVIFFFYYWFAPIRMEIANRYFGHFRMSDLRESLHTPSIVTTIQCEITILCKAFDIQSTDKII